MWGDFCGKNIKTAHFEGKNWVPVVKLLSFATILVEEVINYTERDDFLYLMYLVVKPLSDKR